MVKIFNKFMIFGILLSLLNSAFLFGQEKRQDRWRFIDPKMPTTDDPRRVPIPPGKRGTDRTAGHWNVPFRIKEWVAQSRVPGPRVFPVGQLITGTGGYGAEGLDPIYGAVREVSGPDAWRDVVRGQFKRGADVIKLASHFSREEVAAAISEAHALGLKVCVDAETIYIQWAVEAGADDIEHPL